MVRLMFPVGMAMAVGCVFALQFGPKWNFFGNLPGDIVTGTVVAVKVSEDGQLQDSNDSSYRFDPSKITTVYHLGKPPAFGRTNNQLITILHAMDMVIEDHIDNHIINSGIGTNKNNNNEGGHDMHSTAVVAVSGWAANLLKNFFLNPANDTECSWALELEQLQLFKPVILIHENRLEALNLANAHNNVTNVDLLAESVFYYMKDNWQTYSATTLERRRRAVLGPLFQNVAERNLVEYNALQEYLHVRRDPNQTAVNYVTIHSRWLEGECERRVGNRLPHDECWMSPEYVKDILENSGVLGARAAGKGESERVGSGTSTGVIDYPPIVFISDGQNKEVLQRLQEDPDIGPKLILPSELPTLTGGGDLSQPVSDMMVALHADIFIGTRVSTMARIVGMARVALGKDPATNYIFVGKKKGKEATTMNASSTSLSATAVSSLEVCQDCLFLCNASMSHLCGGQ